MGGGSLTNKQVCSIYKSNGTVRKKVLEVLAEYGKTEDDANMASVNTKIKSVVLKIKNLKKNLKKKAELAEYLQQTFSLPQKNPNATRRICLTPPVTDRFIDSDPAASVNTDLAAELLSVRTQLENSDAELAQAKLTILKLKQFQPNRLNQTIKRHKGSIAKQKLKVDKLKGKLEAALKGQGEPGKPRRRRKKQDDDGGVPPGDRVLRCEACAHMDWSLKFRLDELKTLKERIKALEYEKTTLEDQLKEQKLQTSNIIRSKRDGKKYSVELRQVIHRLVSANVAVTKLEAVIRTVLHTLANKDLDTFPDSKTCRKIIQEMDMVSAFNVASELSKAETETHGTVHTTVKSDGYSSFNTLPQVDDLDVANIPKLTT